ncbi:MAG: 16S rRNA (guanine(966)-N(2))-methyltransferase RsmD [Rhodospirillaceae bacterium]|nr:16S rRNA (guanine(966)-N(2))-methyltransferase RsmD [Rhodospirillaceae bacterium]
MPKRARPSPPQPATPKGRGWLRITGGVWRGRKIPVTAADNLRPTHERAREAIFNRLVHAAETFGQRLQGARVADLFAGTGALGLEALSRGAAAAVFVEQDRTACTAIQSALTSLHAEDRAEVLNADATNLPRAAHPCDIVLMDPPYAADAVGVALASLAARGWLAPGALIVVEAETDAKTASPPAFPPGFTLIDTRTYGRATIWFLSTVK